MEGMRAFYYMSGSEYKCGLKCISLGSLVQGMNIL